MHVDDFKLVFFKSDASMLDCIRIMPIACYNLGIDRCSPTARHIRCLLWGAAVFSALLFATSCGSSQDSARCELTLASSCPAAAPSYSQDIAPILSASCTSCHGPGGQESQIDFTSYSGVYTKRQSILAQIYDCAMPPSGATALATKDAETLLTWLVCGAPNN